MQIISRIIVRFILRHIHPTHQEQAVNTDHFTFIDTTALTVYMRTRFCLMMCNNDVYTHRATDMGLENGNLFLIMMHLLCIQSGHPWALDRVHCLDRFSRDFF